MLQAELVRMLARHKPCRQFPNAVAHLRMDRGIRSEQTFRMSVFCLRTNPDKPPASKALCGLHCIECVFHIPVLQIHIIPLGTNRTFPSHMEKHIIRPSIVIVEIGKLIECTENLPDKGIVGKLMQPS